MRRISLSRRPRRLGGVSSVWFCMIGLLRRRLLPHDGQRSVSLLTISCHDMRPFVGLLGRPIFGGPSNACDAITRARLAHPGEAVTERSQKFARRLFARGRVCTCVRRVVESGILTLLSKIIYCVVRSRVLLLSSRGWRHRK